jgi:KipI family sensor histidine kinase inhibitor
VTRPQGDLAVAPLGDRAVLLTLSGDPDRCNQRIARIADILREEGRRDPRPAILDVAPAMLSLAAFFDPRLISPDEIEKRLVDAAARAPESRGAARPRRLHVIPVVYDGPDLSAAAARLGLSPDELERRHAARVYRVRFLGFAPGFAYLGPLDPTLVLPRLSTPRLRVAAGSVAIAGDQTAIYPLDTPGGWHLVGHTPIRPFDVARDPPSLFAAGDEVRFQPHPA